MAWLGLLGWCVVWLVFFGSDWSELARLGFTWFGLVCIDSGRGSVCFDPVWIRFGLRFSPWPAVLFFCGVGGVNGSCGNSGGDDSDGGGGGGGAEGDGDGRLQILLSISLGAYRGLPSTGILP